MSADGPAPVLFLGQEDVARLLSVAACIDVMSDAMAALARGEVHQPLRQIVRPPDAKGLLGLMPAYIGGAQPVYGAKTAGFFPGNSALGLDPHQGCVLLFSGETGALMAVMSASEITGIRTAAMTGLATRLLARPEASRLALIGSGHQAHWQLQAAAAVRPLASVRVAARTLASARAFVAAEQPNYGFAMEAAESVDAAVCDADIVITVTNASEPILRRDWIAPGAHINAVGSSTPSHCEIEPALMGRASLFVDRRESTLNESGDYLNAFRGGLVSPASLLAEIGELVIGRHPGRTGGDEVTLFKSLGMALEDVAAARWLYERAGATGVGTRLQQ
ncbi:ornithine cyclodeaminase family protein [Variovorax sp. PBL-E5]|uniref:ornithine cyclodeaminase family protein n=1 Tax=Variovorax sp. PBL-E5 TaxID=434014 RepID=UPI001316ADC2|nr:ornithine cyclodeaminase family protein [Variovorax sp. PBL-E5]VTU29724.1 ornithine cyclodeaminase [Variovorax sp. PBL-E5]